MLRLRYDEKVGTAFGQLGIYHWNVATERWQQVGGSIDAEHREVAALVKQLGVYALMGVPAKTYLPLVGAP